MIIRTVQDIAIMTKGMLQGSAGSIKGVSIDSRTISPGNLFVPIIGDTFDGHQFAKQAIDAGAAALLWQTDREAVPQDVPVILVENTTEALQQLAREYRQQLDAKIIGVTGSNGKTTTKDMVAAILETVYTVHKTDGNFNNHLGLPLTLLEATENTQFIVLEMGMSSLGEIKLLSELAQPDVAIVTNIGEAHLAHLGSREAIVEAKMEIWSGLAENGLFIYSGDEPLLRLAVADVLAGLSKYGARAEHVDFIRFGMKDQNDIKPSTILMDELGMSFTIQGLPTTPFRIPMLGRHNVLNACAAIAVGRYFAIPTEQMRQGLAEVKLTSMRAEISQTKSGVTLINEVYNASPTAMKAAIQTLAELSGYKQKIAVLGGMLELGPEEEAYHTEIGRILDPTQIDYVLTYGSLAGIIGREAGRRFPLGHVRMFMDKQMLINELKRLTAAQDVVLIKGSRGMKMEEIVAELLS